MLRLLSHRDKSLDMRMIGPSERAALQVQDTIGPESAGPFGGTVLVGAPGAHEDSPSIERNARQSPSR